MSQLDLLALMALSMVLGAAVGYERESADKPAGLRTHMLVAGAATLLTGLSQLLVTHFAVLPGETRADPIRVIEAVVTGVTFLGAGTIIRFRGNKEKQVEGLTTAASLLFVAAIGIAVALQQFLLSIGSVAIVLLTVGGLRALEKHGHALG